MNPILRTQAEINRKNAGLRTIANRAPKRIRNAMKAAPVTVTTYPKGAGPVVLVDTPAPLDGWDTSMPTPKVLQTTRFNRATGLIEDLADIQRRERLDRQEGLLPTEGYADVVNAIAEGA